MVERDHGGSARIEQQKTVVGHWKKDECSVYIGRSYSGNGMECVPIGERGWLGNPFEVGKDGDREAVVKKFASTFLDRIQSDPKFRQRVAELEGETLGCWCQRAHESDGELCHGEVIKRTVEKLNE